MDSKELRGLAEAYSGVYPSQTQEEVDQLDEISYQTAKSAYDKRKDREQTNSTKKSDETFRRVRKKFGQKVAKQMRRENPWNNMNKTLESYDYYDIILLHLLDEGYAETPEAAEAIMVNMSEKWRQSIIG